jgi:hypothetical protein
MFLLYVFEIFQNKMKEAGHCWLMPIILATWEAEIRRIEV